MPVFDAKTKTWTGDPEQKETERVFDAANGTWSEQQPKPAAPKKKKKK